MTISRFDLLPPNATQLERDLSRATSSLERVGEPVSIIRTAKRVDIPDSVLPWLIYEYGLSEILPFLDNDKREALEVGIQWQRIRGTPESLRIAMGWIGVNALIDESEAGTDRWAEYQLGLDSAATEEIINKIVAIAELSQPARSRLLRIYAGCDYRRAVYCESDWSTGAIYGDHSGIRPRPDWPQINFCQHIRLLVPASTTVGGVSIAHTQITGALFQIDDCFRYGEDRWAEGWHTPNFPILETILEGLSASVEDGRSWLASTHWGQRTWADSLPYCMLAVTTETSGGGGGGGGGNGNGEFELTWTVVPGGANNPLIFGQQAPTFTSTETTSTMTIQYLTALGNLTFSAMYTFESSVPIALSNFTVTGYIDGVEQPGFLSHSPFGDATFPQSIPPVNPIFVGVWNEDGPPEDCVITLVITATRVT